MEEVEKSPISIEEEDTEMGQGDVDENPKSSRKSSSDSESSDSEDEAEQNEQLLTLESELSTNPSNYDAHVQVNSSSTRPLKKIFLLLILPVLPFDSIWFDST